ncbi:FOSL2 family protein [Megaselia abdita]
MKTRQSDKMTKIKLELPERSETPNSSVSEDSQNSDDGNSGRKQFGIVTNSISKKRNIRHPVFVSLNGIQSSVPTVTTPTLTPSTLRSIEQDLFELTAESGPSPYQAGFVPPPAQPAFHITGDNDYSNSNHSNASDSEHSWNHSYDDSELANETEAKYNGLSSPHFPQGDLNSLCATNVERKPRGQGGRRPTKSANLSPEEEEKRRVRRERNKQAAARCRKRRVDQTNDLCEKVTHLENTKASLENEVKILNEQRAALEESLREHALVCKMNHPGGRLSPFDLKPSPLPFDLKPKSIPNVLEAVIKTEPKEEFDDDLPSAPKRALLNDASFYIPTPEHERSAKLPNVSTIITTRSSSLTSPSVPLTPNSLNTPTMIAKSLGFPTLTNYHSPHPLPLLNNNSNQKSSKPRPNSLNVDSSNASSATINGISIQTPSNGNFNYDSLMDGRTGLTPVMPMAPQHINMINQLTSELNTPTTTSSGSSSEPSKLVSL